MSSENIKEAANFFSTSNSAPLLHAPPSPFNLSDLENALPAINLLGLQAHKSFPEMPQESAKSNLSGPTWVSDFTNFQQTQLSSPRQVMASPPSVREQGAQRQGFQPSGLSSMRSASILELTHTSRDVFSGGNKWELSLCPASGGNVHPVSRRYAGSTFASRIGS